MELEAVNAGIDPLLVLHRTLIGSNDCTKYFYEHKRGIWSSFSLIDPRSQIT